MSSNASSIPLGELVSIKGGKRLPKGTSLQSIKNSHPYIRVRDMGQRYIPSDGLEYVPDDVFPKIQRYIVHENDVIISIVGTIGLISIIDSTFHLASQTENAAKLTGLDSIDAHYLYYYLNSYIGQSEIRQRTVGAVQPKLPLYNIETIPVIWPDRSSRAEIVKQLMALDGKIQLNQQINQTLEQMAQAIFKSWFVDFEPVKAKIAALEAGDSKDDALLAAMQVISGKDPQQLTQLQTENPERYTILRVTAELFPAAMQESELGEIPLGWCVCNLGGFIQFSNGKSIKAKECGAYPVYGANGIIGMTDTVKFSNAIIVGRVGAYCGAVVYSLSDFWASDNTIVASSINDPEMLPYLFYQLQLLDLNQYAGGAAQPLLNQTTLKSIEVVFPSENLIYQFNKLVQGFMEISTSNVIQNNRLIELRDTLLPKLLSGELAIIDAE